MSYLTFLRDNWRFVGFGAFLTMVSSFGQTYYIALYGADIRAEFELSNGGFGALYSIASIASAAALIWLGKQIDRVDIRVYTTASLAALFAGMVLLSTSTSILLFGLAIFVVRFCGQGLCVHIASTCMARYFVHNRGKALSVSGLGLAIGEAYLPITTVALIAGIGWRDSWWVTAAVFALLSLALLPVFLKGQSQRHQAYVERLELTAKSDRPERLWTRRDVLGDPGFRVILALLMAYPFTTTGVLFHQAFVADVKGWDIEVMAVGFVVLAAMKVLTSLIVGQSIDRFGATILVPATALPWIAAYFALAVSDSILVPFIYLGLFGVGIGMLQPILSAVLAERYGVANLGGIRAMSIAGIVLSAAIAPATVGWMLDAGATIEWMSIAFVVYILIAALIAQRVISRERRAEAPGL